MLTAARVVAVAAAVAGLSTAVSCSDERAPPSHLVDGSPARLVTVPFESVSGPVIATVVRSGRGGSRGCEPQLPRSARAIERIGVAGASTTLVVAGVLHACDASRRGEWCGQGFARAAVRPFDPRLSITCRDSDGNPVGFAWVRPSADTDVVVVAHDGYAEAFAVTGTVPIRVTTADVNLSTASAHIELTEHTADGRRLRARSVEAQVSG